jgi:tRNA/rRNA methyltransferase
MAAPDTSDDNKAGGPAIILVEPQLGENIGMVARAMANFGLRDLRLVNPRDGWPNEKAIATASRADHVIGAVQVFEKLDHAIADLNFLYATTARQRDGFKAVRSPVEAARAMRQRAVAKHKTGILFGREKYGLSNEEVAASDEIVTFPVDPNFASLNIAQAVLLMSYEWMKSGLADETATAFAGPDITPAPKVFLQSFLGHLEEALAARGYFRPPPKKPKMVDNLRAVLTRPGFTQAEIKLLRGVLNSLDFYSPNVPRGAGGPDRDAAIEAARTSEGGDPEGEGA